MNIINSEIQKLKSKTVILNTDKRTGDYISGVLTTDGSHRMILNLKNLTNLYATDISRWSQNKMY